jgi:hypothetical protein
MKGAIPERCGILRNMLVIAVIEKVAYRAPVLEHVQSGDVN